MGLPSFRAVNIEPSQRVPVLYVLKSLHPLLTFLLRLLVMTWFTQRLQVAHIVCAALGLVGDVVTLKVHGYTTTQTASPVVTLMYFTFQSAPRATATTLTVRRLGFGQHTLIAFQAWQRATKF